MPSNAGSRKTDRTPYIYDGPAPGGDAVEEWNKEQHKWGEAFLDLSDAFVRGFRESWGIASIVPGTDIRLRILGGVVGGFVRGHERAYTDTDGYTRPFDPNRSTYRTQRPEERWGGNPLQDLEDLGKQLVPSSSGDSAPGQGSSGPGATGISDTGSSAVTAPTTPVAPAPAPQPERWVPPSPPPPTPTPAPATNPYQPQPLQQPFTGYQPPDYSKPTDPNAYRYTPMDAGGSTTTTTVMRNPGPQPAPGGQGTSDPRVLA